MMVWARAGAPPPSSTAAASNARRQWQVAGAVTIEPRILLCINFS
jgi:hypothetical protein